MGRQSPLQTNFLTAVLLFQSTTNALAPGKINVPSLPSTSSPSSPTTLHNNNNNNDNDNDNDNLLLPRRQIFPRILLGSTAALTAAATPFCTPQPANAKSGAFTESTVNPEFVQKYEDFLMAPEGWQYKDTKVGTGDVVVETGDRAVFDWSGYTVGYFGRPFEAKGGPQGGAFDKDLDYSRTVIGSHTVVPALEQALTTMKPGGIRQVVIPYGALSYPPDDLEHTRVGPKPTTFSGQRALNFVLENPRVDRTLLINVKFIRLDKANGKGGFIRG